MIAHSSPETVTTNTVRFMKMLQALLPQNTQLPLQHKGRRSGSGRGVDGCGKGSFGGLTCTCARGGQNCEVTVNAFGLRFGLVFVGLGQACSGDCCLELADFGRDFLAVQIKRLKPFAIVTPSVFERVVGGLFHVLGFIHKPGNEQDFIFGNARIGHLRRPFFDGLKEIGDGAFLGFRVKEPLTGNAEIAEAVMPPLLIGQRADAEVGADDRKLDVAASLYVFETTFNPPGKPDFHDMGVAIDPGEIDVPDLPRLDHSNLHAFQDGYLGPMVFSLFVPAEMDSLQSISSAGNAEAKKARAWRDSFGTEADKLLAVALGRTMANPAKAVHPPFFGWLMLLGKSLHLRRQFIFAREALAHGLGFTGHAKTSLTLGTDPMR